MRKSKSSDSVKPDDTTPDKKKATPYCKNSDLLKELIECKKSGVISNKLGEYFLSIAWHLTGHSNFRRYSYSLKEDFVGLGVMKMIKGVKSFDPEKSKNAFAYFTQICWNSFIYSCKEYYKQINVKKQIFENYLISVQAAQNLDPNGLVETYLKDLLESNETREQQEKEIDEVNS